MGLTLATKEFERSLAVNIALLARIFKKRYDVDKMDAAAQDCRDYITKKVRSLGVEDSDHANVENMFVMILMHTACKDMLGEISQVAKERGVPESAVVEELAIKMMREAGIKGKEG